MNIIGIGNALTDMLIPIENYGIANDLGLSHGGMVMIDDAQFALFKEKTSHLDKSFAAGGSAGNTIYGTAKLGLNASFIGKVGDDEVGREYEKDMKNNNVTPILLRGDKPSGCAMAFITPDSERTFASYLGAAQTLTPEDVNEDMLRGHDLLHIEGYLLFNHELVLAIVKMAKHLGITVSLDLAAHNFVKENRDMVQLLVRDYVDICFANEEESMALTGTDPKNALDKIANSCDYAVVKTGSKGALIKHKNEISQIPAYKVSKVVDTTGAGDLYAAGFFFGLANDYSMNVCGKIGALVAATVIQNYGTRISDDNWSNIKQNIADIVK